MSKVLAEKWMQVDVISIQEKAVVCNLYTDGRAVRVIMAPGDYQLLCNDGFFLRRGDKPDSAGVLNTSREYFQVTKD